jgi:hypothetical protein
MVLDDFPREGCKGGSSGSTCGVGEGAYVWLDDPPKEGSSIISTPSKVMTQTLATLGVGGSILDMELLMMGHGRTLFWRLSLVKGRLLRR